MQITIFSGFSKEHNSTKQPSGGTAVNCYLKDDTSLINPVFVLDGANFSVNYVQWGSRYYFVDDVVSIRNSTVELHCSVDAMASWKSNIGASSQYVTRSASAYNDYIIDSVYPSTVHTSFESVAIEGLFNTGLASVVVGVVGKNGLQYYLFTMATLQSILFDFLYGSGVSDWLDAPLTEISMELQKELVNPFQYIVSCMVFPFQITSDATGDLIFGYWTKSGQIVDLVTPSARFKQQISSVAVPRHPQSTIRGAYMNSAPYTRMTLNMPCFGTIPLDPQNYVDTSRLTVQLNTDLFTGVGELRLSNTGDSDTIYTQSAQIGVPIQISQITQNLINTAVATVSTIGSIATGNALGALFGAKSAIENMMPQIQTSGSMGSLVNFIKQPMLTMQYKNLVTVDNEHLGRPLMERRTISTLSGFIQIENPDIDIPATTQEKDIISNYMRSGFYYE